MKKSIAVLGAGPMGLAVAYQLARDGHRPVVFEADDRIGASEICLPKYLPAEGSYFNTLSRLGIGNLGEECGVSLTEKGAQSLGALT